MRRPVLAFRPVRPSATTSVSSDPDPVAAGQASHGSQDRGEGLGPDHDADWDEALKVVAQEDEAAAPSKEVKSADAMVTQAGVEDVPPAPTQRYQRPRPLAEVKQPSPAEVARHNLTHLPYRSWC